MKLDPTSLIAGAALYAAIMPDLAEVRHATPGSEMAYDVHNGVVVGTIVLVGIGAFIAMEEKSPQPLYMLGGLALIIAAAFEWTLHQAGTVTVTAEPGGRSDGVRYRRY